MAEVFLARTEGPRGFSKTLVLKRILPHLAGDEQFVEMFLSEARLVAQINHPNVVQIYDFGEFDGSYYIAMEFIDGPNLRTLMRKAGSLGQSLPPALCAKMVASACEGLAHAHELVDPETQKPFGLVHRDVSPDNILIDRNGTVKVVDFGIAKAVGQKNLTKAGMVKGKLPYMPPEQMRGRPLDRRVDVFALGMVLYELLTFRRPFSAKGEADIMEAILHKPMKRISEYLPGAPEALERIVQRCLAKNRDERYPSCRQLRADLDRYILSTGEPVGSEELAALVARLMPAGQAPPSAADPISSPNKSPVHQALPRATHASSPKPRPSGTRTSSPKARALEPVPKERPPPESQPSASNGTDRSLILLVNRKAAPPSAEFAAPAASGEHPVPERAPAAIGEVVLSATSPMKVPERSSKSWGFKAALAGSLVAAACTAALLGRARFAREEQGPPAVLPGSAAKSVPPTDDPAPQVEPPASHDTPTSSPPSEETAAEESEDARPSETPVELPPSSPPSEVQQAEGGDSVQVAHPETQKSGALAKRPKVRTGGGSAAPSKRDTVPEHAPEAPVPSPVESTPFSQPAAPETSSEQPQLASAVLSSTPPAQIRVNGHFVGLSPVTLRNHPPGPIHVEVYDSVKGFSKRQTFVLEPGDNGALEIPVHQGTLKLQIQPSAAVTLDGKHLGLTSTEPITLYEGLHSLQLESAALNKRLSTTVTIAPGEATVFQFDFEATK